MKPAMRNCLTPFFSLLLCTIILLPIPGIAGRRKMASSHFPMTAGSRWVYAVHDSVRHHTDTLSVRILGATRLPDGRNAMMWRYRTRTFTDTEYVVRSGDTISIYRTPERSSVRAVFAFPLVAGRSWTVIPPGSMTVVRLLTTATPAAVFRHSFEVIARPAVRNFVGETTYWLEPHVGIVRILVRSVDTINNQEENTLWELIAWTIAR
jgi:hypothetical protein